MATWVVFQIFSLFSEESGSLTAAYLKLEGLMLFYKVYTHNMPNIWPFISTLKIFE